RPAVGPPVCCGTAAWPPGAPRRPPCPQAANGPPAANARERTNTRYRIIVGPPSPWKCVSLYRTARRLRQPRPRPLKEDRLRNRLRRGVYGCYYPLERGNLAKRRPSVSDVGEKS